MCYFSSSGRLATCVERTELQSILKQFIENFSSNEIYFNDCLGMGFQIPAYEENRIFQIKSVVGFYRGSLLRSFTNAGASLCVSFFGKLLIREKRPKLNYPE